MMNMKLMHILAMMLMATISFAAISTSGPGSNNAWDRWDISFSSLTSGTSENVTMNNIYGDLRYFSYLNAGDHSVNFTLYDESGNMINTTTLASGASSSNRTASYTTFGKMTAVFTDILPFTAPTAYFRLDDSGVNSGSGAGTIEPSTDTTYADAKIKRGVQLGSTGYMKLNYSASAYMMGEDWATSMWVNLPAGQNLTYLFHQGVVGTTELGGTYAEVYPYNATHDKIEWQVLGATTSTATNNTALTLTNISTSRIVVLSSAIPNSLYDATATITYTPVNASNCAVNVSVGGVIVGTLNGTSPRAMTISQDKMTSRALLLAFSQDMGNASTSITGISISYTAKTNQSLTYTQTAFAGAWEHLSFVYTNSSMAIYKNGINLANKSITADTRMLSIEPYYWGDGETSSLYNKGLYDEIYIFNSAINAANALSVYSETGKSRGYMTAIIKK